MSIRTNKKNKVEVSLNQPIGTDKDGNEISLDDILGTDPDAVLDDINLKMQIKRLYDVVNSALTGRERMVIVKRYGIFGQEAKTQREVATELNISRSYVSRIEKKAILKLREEISE